MPEDTKKKMLDSLISTTKLLNYPMTKQLLKEFPKPYITEAARTELQKVRDIILSSGEKGLKGLDISPEKIDANVDILVRSSFKPSIRPAINAAGIILHTGLGRAPYAEEAQKAVADAIKNYCTLAVDVPTGKRGNRYSHVESLLKYITGAEAACVVNNNAAAVLLVLNTLAEDKEVLVSRGQLVEIGGAFRIPDVMRRSGAAMVEIGTTNRTHLFDYENAVTEETAMIQVVHPSNYRIIGFTGQVPIEELRPFAEKHDIPIVEDIGSGCLVDFTKYGLPEEPLVQDSLKAGADVVTFSGDKILGGPQCGIIVGRKKYIDRIKKNPLCRALRNDKLTYAVLEATLKLFIDEHTLLEKHPTMRMLTLPMETLARRVRRFVRLVKPRIGNKCTIKVISSETQMGSGSLPGKFIPTKAASITSEELSAEQIATSLRLSDPPVFPRVENDQVILDFRTVLPEEIKTLAEVVIGVFKK
ncbi:L-seryl-tRNA(Sec) selenium transferase [candidate division KSB1 bacterium]